MPWDGKGKWYLCFHSLKALERDKALPLSMPLISGAKHFPFKVEIDQDPKQNANSFPSYFTEITPCPYDTTSHTEI